MAEPSDRPAINNGPGGRKKGGCEDEKGKNEVKKVGEKNFTYRSNKVRTIQTSREKMVKSFSLGLKTKNTQPFRQQPKPKVPGYSEQKKLGCRGEPIWLPRAYLTRGDLEPARGNVHVCKLVQELTNIQIRTVTAERASDSACRIKPTRYSRRYFDYYDLDC